jgi:hypothetical protein
VAGKFFGFAALEKNEKRKWCTSVDRFDREQIT